MCAFDTKSLEINARAKSPSRKICQRYRVMQKVIYSDNCVTCISFMELLIFVNIASTHFPVKFRQISCVLTFGMV